MDDCLRWLRWYCQCYKSGLLYSDVLGQVNDLIASNIKHKIDLNRTRMLRYIAIISEIAIYN